MSFAAQLAQDLPPEDLRHIFEIFAADIARLTGVLRAAAAAGDAETFRKVAHSLAGAAGAVGATEMDAICRLAMTRTDIGPGEFVTIAGEISKLGAEAVAEANAYVAGL